MGRENDMKINLFFNSNKDTNYLISFLNHSKKIKFFFYKIDQIKKFKSSKVLFVVENATNIKDFIKFYNNILKDFNNIFYMFPLKFLKGTDIIFENKIYYPVSLSLFNNSLLNFFQNKFFLHEEVILSNENLLINLTNKKKIYLTEIESGIIKLLVVNKSLSRDLIKERILKLKKEIDSKSFDTHLYRLRNKLSLVTNKIIIKSADFKNIELVKLID